MTWSLRDLFVDHNTGRLRESKVWSNIGKAVMTWAFAWVIYKGGSSEFLWITYGSIVCGHELATRFLNQKEKAASKETPA